MITKVAIAFLIWLNFLHIKMAGDLSSNMILICAFIMLPISIWNQKTNNKKEKKSKIINAIEFLMAISGLAILIYLPKVIGIEKVFEIIKDNVIFTAISILILSMMLREVFKEIIEKQKS